MRDSIRPGSAALACAVLLGLASAAAAQQAEAPAAEEATKPAEAPAPPTFTDLDEYGRGTPQSAVLGYLKSARDRDWERAAQYLNLSPVPAAEREERGPDLAKQLKTILDRTLWIETDLLSSQPEGFPEDGLPQRRDLVGVIKSELQGKVPVYVERQRTAEGRDIWKIAGATVAQIPRLDDEFGNGVLGRYLPPIFFDARVLEVQLWQWIAIVLVLMAAWLGSWLVVRVLARLTHPIVETTESTVDDHLFSATLGPLRLAFALGIAATAMPSLDLALVVERVVVGLMTVVGIVAGIWFALRLIDLLSMLSEGALRDQNRTSMIQLVPLGRKSIKVAVVAVGVLAALDSLGFNVTALIAGLGIGGLAVALALQKTLENLFGGATILADRPVRVGDFCRFGGRVGTVEEIGLRSTRVRTLDRTVVSIPNAEFSLMQLENFGRRDKIWYHPTIGLRYETTPEQLRYVLVEVRKMLYSHPRVDPDPARIRFTGFGAYSLDLEIFAYVLCTDFGEFLEVAEDLNLRVMDIVEAAGTGFAFPSSTTYVARDEGLDSERGRAAEAQVQQWREMRELGLPGFPPERIRELRNTLDYPPTGSALAKTEPR